MGYYQDINRKYGLNTTHILKQWANHTTKLAAMKNRRIFLLRCRKENVIPNHITRNNKMITKLLTTEDHKISNKINLFNKKLTKHILNFEIEITCSNIKSIENIINRFRQSASKLLPNYIVSDFDKWQDKSFTNHLNKIKLINIKKYNKLKENIIKDKMFNDNQKWFVNLTKINFPKEISDFLSLGPKFSLSPNNNEIDIGRLISNVESILETHPTKLHNILRAKITNILTNYLQNSNNNNKNNSNGIIWTKCRKFLKENPSILILRADKGAVTVAMNNDDYYSKASNLLNDVNTYKKIKNDPTATFQKKNNDMIKFLLNKNIIDKDLAKNMYTYNASAPKFYAVPKIHKENIPLRPIVSSINTPNTAISKFLTDILTKTLGNYRDYNIKNSFEFANKYNNFKLPPNYVLVSFDVVSLFTNIPLNLVIEIITLRWNIIEEQCGFDLDTFIKALKLIFETSYFCYKDEFFLQIFGTPMGSVLSPILSNIVMDFLLDTVKTSLNFDLILLKKYVDDIICAVPFDCIDSTLDILNNFNEHLKFTVEREDKNNSIPFLDTKIIRGNDNVLMLDWYQKPTASGRYINFFSDHPYNMKINIIKAMKNRILKICHPNFRYKNLTILFNIFHNNGYPKNLLTKIIYNNITNDVANNTTNITDTILPTQIIYKKLPLINNLTNKLIGILKNNNIKISRYNTKCIGRFFTSTKSRTPNLFNSNIVYSVPCKDCEMIYVGQTKQWIKTRLSQHRSDIKLNKKTCALAIHANTKLHNINFDDFKILDKEIHYKTRLFLETINIQNSEKTMNFKTDTEGLSTIYSNIFEKIKKVNNNTH